jgi:tetratricopeptide (TPR) repeat protein
LERSGLRKAIAIYYTELGFLKMLTGDPLDARMYFERALTLYRDTGAEQGVLAILANLADVSWALGDLDTALACFRDTIVQLRKSSLARRENIGIALTNIAGIHTERGELDEALTAAHEGLPLLKERGQIWYLLDHLALRAALASKVGNAARLTGYIDSAFTANESSRQPNEARARDRLQTLLHDKLSIDELERLLADGAKISEDEACRLALED